MPDESELDRLRREIATLKSKLAESGRIKVSPKGGVSVYGLGKWPITLYKGQWLRLLEMSEDIREFIRDHVNELAEKGDG